MPLLPQPPVKTNVVVKRKNEETGEKWLNNYRKVRSLAEGSYGKVKLYQANQKLYAIKVIYRSKRNVTVLAHSNTLPDATLQEVSTLSALPRHKNVVRLVEVIDDPESSKVYVVMEYGGVPLESFSPSFLKQSLEGLRHLHASGVAHGDLKVEHLLRDDRTGVVKIVDFGSSEVFRNIEENDTLVRSPGTPAYTAPECCTGEPYSSRKADVWALGIAFFVLRYGTFPFQSKSADDMYEEIRNTEVCFPEPETHFPCSPLLRRMLSRDPEARPSADQLLRHMHMELSNSSVNEIEDNFARSVGF